MVNHGNGSISIDTIKDTGHNFLIAKATEGSTFIDKYYNNNIAKAKALGLVNGAYHFARFTTKDKAIQEANFFKAVAAGANPDFVVLDFEQQCSGDMTDVCLAFLEIVSSCSSTYLL
ncbi:glycoside hydrolase family 25 protein [Clostridium kluyveri]|uniref:glycoside hydrolase family 25 protein n=1 Tax=Clostridium kluyveri TaxID=1534 RepID=UPI002247A3AD|nr:glycoside hydrolase family 25 protein [Clostridium kluyveri]UZQ49559.1 glycoside hydrolase family 25 protein [Clostridium kluyveri]